MPNSTATTAVPGRFDRALITVSLFVGSLISGLISSTAVAQEPLHARVDAALALSQTGPVTHLASDAEFLRRVYLDLVGTLPSPTETRTFLADTTPDKRPKMVDRLLADPRHALHWAEVLDVWFMERRHDKYVPHADWLKYLQTSVVQNKPWNQYAKELFTSDGTDPATRPTAKFFLDRDSEPNLLTRDIGRVFFGVDLQCAQCHDHPLVDHYLQSDYYGLYAFVNRTVNFNDEAAKVWVTGEKADGNADFQSVFTKDAGRSRPRFPGGIELEEPHFPLGEEYVVAPADKVRPVPKFSRRGLLVEATTGQSIAFNRNLPNRIWAYLFGRGLVHPVDWQHPHNPATSPEVLDLLTQETVASGFNMQHLLRELILTAAYQRTIDPPVDRMARFPQVAEQLPLWQQRVTEQTASVQQAAEQQQALYTQMQAAREPLIPLDQAYQQAVQAALALKKPFTDAQAALTATNTQIGQKQAVITALTDAGTKAAEAVKLLPNDAEVTQAATLFTTKLATANTELAALQNTVATQTAAVQDAQTKWAAGVATSETAFQAYVAATPTWEAAKQTWYTARQTTLAAAAQLEFSKAQLQDWEKAQQWSQRLSELAAAEQAVPVVDAELVAAQQNMTDQQVVVTTATVVMTTATQQVQTAQQQLDLAAAELAMRQAVAQPVQEALSNVESALQQLAGDAALTDVQAKLTARLEPLATAQKEAAAVVATQTTAKEIAVTNQQAATQMLAAATAELTARQQVVDAKTAATSAARAKVETSAALASAAWSETAAVWEREFVTRIEKPLTPEQLTYSVAAATTMLDIQVYVADAEIEKTTPKATVAADPGLLLNRERLVHGLVRERMRGHVNVFVGLYGAGPGQPQDQFFASADQALFLANGGTLLSWLNPAAENLTVRLLTLDDPSAFADELYVTIFSRSPRPEETARVAEYLAARTADRTAAIRELMWALLTSAEFRFNL
jgi:hypothetical protein